MEMPTPQAEHQKLAALAGTWSGEETMHPSPWAPAGSSAIGKITSRMDLGSFFLISDYTQEKDGQVTFRGHGVYGWDAHHERYTIHWFDSMGMDPGAPAPGTWEGDVLCFQHETAMGHARYTYTFVDADHYSFKLENSLDGESWTPMMDGQYTRQA